MRGEPSLLLTSATVPTLLKHGEEKGSEELCVGFGSAGSLREMELGCGDSNSPCSLEN